MKRILTAAVLVPFFLYIILIAPRPGLLATLAVVGALVLFEFLQIASAHFELRPPLSRNPVPYAAGLVFLILPSHEAVFLGVLAVILMIQSLRAADLSDCLPLAAVALLGVIYVFGAWRCAAGLRAISPLWLLFALAINWVGDTFAYYAGRAFGRHRLAPRISPAKSWEGAAASILGTLVLGLWFFHRFLPNVPLIQAIVLCLAANVAGQVGDLCESAFKRGAGVKDSGNLLPGHGGWLDRVDSSLFSVPVVYWLIQQSWFLP